MPPPGAGLKTVTLTVPVEIRSLARICALSEVGLPYVVVLGDPFHRMTEPLTKFVPVTVSGKAPLVVVAEFGDRVATVGTGLTTLNGWALDVPPPGAGLKTVTLMVPVEIRSLARICALSEVGLPYVVVLGDPFHRTTEPLTKFVPVTVSGKAPLTVVAELGDRAATDGTGLFTVNESVLDVPPPGAGLVTAITAIVAFARSPVGIVAVKDVLLTKTVVRADPFH